MKSTQLRANIYEFSLPAIEPRNEAVVIPAVKGTNALKYGIHAYYFLNFRTLKGFRVEIRHRDIVCPGLSRFINARYGNKGVGSKVGMLFEKYHFGFNILEQLMLMTVPHTVAYAGESKFLINLWSYFGFISIDCKNKDIRYITLPDNNKHHVLGSQQWIDRAANEVWYMTYSLRDSFARMSNPNHPVECKIYKRGIELNGFSEVWNGEFADYMHDILIDKNRRYCVIPELGMYADSNQELLPSKVIILDLAHRKEWSISRFRVAAHAQFDPNIPDIIYFSSHNFRFHHGNILQLLRNASYSIKFFGPASVFKYQLTPEGPREVGVFTDPGMFRLTNFHVFNHRNRTIIAAMGSPNFIFLADSTEMKLIRKIEVVHERCKENGYKGVPCLIGTFSPSLDGEKLYVHTTRSFQVIDIASGIPDLIVNHSFNHSCSNHMLTSPDTDW